MALGKNEIVSGSTPIFIKYGVRNITMDDIANEFGISKKTLYQIFESKNDLLFQVFSLETDRFSKRLDALRSDSKDAIDELLNLSEFLKRIIEASSPTLLDELMKYYPNIYLKILDLKQRTMAPFIQKNLVRGLRENFYRKDISVIDIEESFTNILELIFNNKDKSFNQIADFFFHLFIGSLLSTQGLSKYEDYKG